MRPRIPTNIWLLLLAFVVGGMLGVAAVPVAKSILPSSWIDALRSKSTKQDSSTATNTIFHNLSVSVVATPFREPYGAIDVLGDDLIVADRFGHTWLTDDSGKFTEVPFVIPANAAELTESAEAKQQLAHVPGYFEGVSRRFGVKDLLLIPAERAPINYWHHICIGRRNKAVRWFEFPR